MVRAVLRQEAEITLFLCMR